MFDIQRGIPIVFYGYSQFDTVKEKHLEMQKLGYQVLGYIDQNAHELKKRHVTSWTVNEFPYHSRDRKGIIVILLLQNGRIHENVAESLHKNGFEKILFLPRNGCTDLRKRMIHLYNLFLKSEYDALNDIPLWSELSEKEPEDLTILQKDEKSITTFVPIELLFEYAKKSGKESNLYFSEIYNEIFDFLEGKITVCNAYCTFMGADTKEKADQLLSDRVKLYGFWERQRHRDMQYFVEAAPFVTWNTKGYFNIVDGHHRLMYQLRKGYRQVPVSMTYEDLSCWKIPIDTKISGRLKTLHVPIPHPAYLEEACMYETHWLHVIRYLYQIGYRSSCRLVEFDNYMGYYAGAFQRIVKEKALIVAESGFDVELFMELSRYTYQTIDVVKIDEFKTEANDIFYLKLYEKTNSTMQDLLQKARGHHILIDLPEDLWERLEADLNITVGNIITVCKYYRERAFIVLAIEKEIF